MKVTGLRNSPEQKTLEDHADVGGVFVVRGMVRGLTDEVVAVLSAGTGQAYFLREGMVTNSRELSTYVVIREIEEIEVK